MRLPFAEPHLEHHADLGHVVKHELGAAHQGFRIALLLHPLAHLLDHVGVEVHDRDRIVLGKHPQGEHRLAVKQRPESVPVGLASGLEGDQVVAGVDQRVR